MPENMSQRKKILIGVAILVLVLAGGYYWYRAKGSTLSSFSFVAQDIDVSEVKSWNFQGAYTGNAALEAKAKDEISRLKGFFGNKQHDPTDYSIDVSIANQYGLLGDGKDEYAYLKKALAIDSENTGLAWNNLGSLLAQLGAPKGARDAYARAFRAQNLQVGYANAYLQYLTDNFKDDTPAIDAAFNDAHTSIGDHPTILQIRAEWLANVGRIQEAIDEWKKVKALSPASAPTIDAEIKRLQSQL